MSVNRTIDDQRGDNVTGVVPLYLPDGAWNIGQMCNICSIRPGDPIDPTQVFDGTWHDTTSTDHTEPIIQVNFTGHAVYVYNIIVNIVMGQNVATTTDLTFYVDDHYVAYYTRTPIDNTTAPAVSYNKLVYSNASLEQGEHILQIKTANQTRALTLFDYVVYSTYEDDAQVSPSSLSQSSQPVETSPTGLGNPQTGTHAPTVGIVAGGAVGGAVVVVAAACMLYALHARRTRRHKARLGHIIASSHPDAPQDADAIDGVGYSTKPTRPEELGPSPYNHTVGGTCAKSVLGTIFCGTA
ncbi:hypothetical protein C8Q73DRAFT_795209 [Cubamyces lactineus]|nr:hypothetical protein C8Q73DRAFT_795209 [Cubamyces lactineus]